MRNFIGLFSIIIASFLIKSNELASLKKHSKNFVDKISQFNRNHRVVYTQPEQVHISYGGLKKKIWLHNFCAFFQNFQ